MQTKKCDVCSSKHNKSIDTCDYCQVIINRLKKRKHQKKSYGAKIVKKALQRANPIIDKKGNVMFQCQYTKIYGYFNIARKIIDPDKDACVLTMDHKDPNDPKSLVVSLLIINEMKHNLSREKFQNIVITLGKYYDEEMNEEGFKKKFKKLIDCHK